jgi:hypothetical protein
MPWTRYIYQPTRLIKSQFTDEIQQLIRRCKMGQQPVLHDLPFTMSVPTKSVHLNGHLIHETIVDIKSAAVDIGCYPHYQTFWICTNGHTMTPDPQQPVFLSRTWIHERNGGLNWLTAMQIADAKDMQQVMTSTWTPFQQSQPKPQLK